MLESALWISLWVAGGAIYVYLIRHGINYIDRFYVTAIYFAVASVAVGYPFRELLLPLLDRIGSIHVAALSALVLAQFLVHGLARKFLVRPDLSIRAYPHIYWLRMDYRYLVSKPVEILFQQTLIVSLVLILQRYGLDWPLLSVVFAVLFSLLHIPIIPMVGKFFGYYYLVSSLIGAFVFPWVILEYPDGFVFSYLMHWAYYLVSAVWFWIFPVR